MKLVINFESSVVGDFHDVLRLVSDNKYIVEIPLHALQPTFEFEYEKIMKFGFVKVGKEQKRELVFRNVGSKVGKLELRIQRGKDFLKIEPTQLVVEPQQQAVIHLTYFPKETGIFHGTLELTMFSPQEQYNTVQSPAFIDLTATVVEFSRHLVDQDKIQI